MSETFQTVLRGHCHCGNLAVVFETQLRPDELPLRACSCSYCRRQGAHTTSDPKGHAEITVRDPANLSRYQFGLKTHEFFVCRRCGVYVVAVCEIDGSCYATINANTLEERAQLTADVKDVSYGDENASGRIARRKAAWTPAHVDVQGAGPDVPAELAPYEPVLALFFAGQLPRLNHARHLAVANLLFHLPHGRELMHLGIQVTAYRAGKPEKYSREVTDRYWAELDGVLPPLEEFADVLG